MAYDSITWTDQVDEHPNTYTETTNEDGSVTHKSAKGEEMQRGTPLSATNFNHLEKGLQHFSIAFDMFSSITQAETRDNDARIKLLEAKIAVLSS